MELINTLGINGWLLFWQVLLFFVLLAVLRIFAYKPVLAALEDREKRIAKGLKDAERAAKDAAHASSEKEKTLRAARQEAEKILADARVEAEQLRSASDAETKRAAEKILADGRTRLAAEKENVMRSVEGDMAEVVTDAVGRVLGRTLTEKDHEHLVKEVMAVLEKSL